MADLRSDWTSEIGRGERFRFGANWLSFLRLLGEERILAAEQSLKVMLETDRLDGKRFLDAGSGSGLFSLAARRLGADVLSFDYDPQSVSCTIELKRRYFRDDPHWTIEAGSVLDKDYLERIGTFDIVYSWGVLHHTGAMWQAIENIARVVHGDGLLFVALYNDQGRASVVWKRVKRAYARLPAAMKWSILLPAFARLWGPTLVRDLLRWSPLRSWRGYARNSRRGMDPWHDLVDWVGGYPFEVSRPEEVIDFYHSRGFQLRRLKTCGGGLGCNEYVFVRTLSTK